MRVLLTGGAGFIGTHVAVALAEAGHEPLIVDDLSNAHAAAIERVERLTGTPVPALNADIRDEPALEAFLTAHAPVDAVIHLAGLKSVAESVEDPLRYYDVNIGSTLSLLRVMARRGIRTLVFSSSATVYGATDELPTPETAPIGRDLANPYGRTKAMIEDILRDAATADPTLRIVALRYFNPVGAHPSGMLGEDPLGRPNNLMPVVARAAAGTIDAVTVFGDDYDTPDGTGLRDYVHVDDLATGHVFAAERAEAGFDAVNLGTGVPVSVLDAVREFSAAAGREIAVRIVDRRPGDVAASYADVSKAASVLGWRAERSFAQACRDSWNWHTQNPSGYAVHDR